MDAKEVKKEIESHISYLNQRISGSKPQVGPLNEHHVKLLEAKSNALIALAMMTQ